MSYFLNYIKQKLSVSKHVRPGYNLIEIMAVIVIMVLLVGGAAVFVRGRIAKARTKTTDTSLKTVQASIDEFHMDFNKYPDQLEDLVERPQDQVIASRWNQYLEKFPRDGWGNNFVYQVPGENGQPYDLYSYGPNGPMEEPDKYISVWGL